MALAESSIAGDRSGTVAWEAITKVMVRLSFSFGNHGTRLADFSMLFGVTSLTSLSSEYQAATEACGLVNRSPRGKLALTGSQAKSFLQGQVTNDVEALSSGAGCYAAFLTPKGKMLGDLRILDASLQQVARSASGLAGQGDAGAVQLLLLDTERVALQELFNLIRRFSIGYDAQLHKRTTQSGLVSLIGPASGPAAGATELPEIEPAHLLEVLHGVGQQSCGKDHQHDPDDGEELAQIEPVAEPVNHEGDRQRARQPDDRPDQRAARRNRE